MKLTGNNFRNAVENRLPFKGSNIIGKQEGTKYVVYSYEWWPIVAFINGEYYINTSKYSNTTSRHQSKCRPYTGTMNFVTIDELKEIIQKVK